MVTMEQVVLVDSQDLAVGVSDRDMAHLRGLLHRAVSVFVLDGNDRILLQRRARTKVTFPGLWANTCCTHPRPDEDVVSAGERRLRQEMGLGLDLTWVGSFIYRAEDEVSEYVEHELDHVLVGWSEEDPVLDLREADDFKWVDIETLRKDVATGSEYVPWLAPALDVLESG